MFLLDCIYKIDELRDMLTPIFVKYDLLKVSIFGSYARGTALENSDINLLIFIDENFDLEDYINFKKEVTKAVGKNIDVLEYRCINRRMEADILNEAVLLYEKR